MKNMPRKCEDENSSLQYALLQYRNTPLPDTGYLLAQALFGRRLCTKLLISTSLLQPSMAPPAEIIASKERSHDVLEYYFNRGATELESLHPQQPVWVKDALCDTKWQPGTIQSTGPTLRSFVVTIEAPGGIVSRNRRFLRPRTEIKKPSRFSD